MIYPDLLNWKEMDMNPYLSGGLCRMTKQGACRWSTHGSQSGNLWSSTCCCTLCSPLAKSKLASRTTGKDIRLRALYSVRHSPQFMGAFHSFGLECFIYSANIWTCALLAWISHCSVCSIVDCTAPAAALALVLNCSSSLSHLVTHQLTRNVLSPDQLEPAYYGWTTDLGCNQLVTLSTILAVAAFLNQSTILNARMQSTEKP